MDKSKIDEHLKKIVDRFDQEDIAVRNFKLRKIRKLKFYWSSVSNIYWSETAGDYRVYGGGNGETSSDSSQELYDKPANVYRAFLETIIAALSIQIPAINCAPDDAENPSDQSTARAGTHIAELLYKQQDAVYLFLHMIYIYVTEGLVAGYTYSKTDKSYGMYKENKYKKEKIKAYVCPHCLEQVDDSVVEDYNMQKSMQEEARLQDEQQLDGLDNEQLINESESFDFQQQNKFDPDGDDSELDSLLDEGGLVCPQCAGEIDPNLEKSDFIITRLTGVSDTPKSRVCFDLFGELYLKVPQYARCQEDMPYIIWSYETHYAKVLEMYGKDKELWDKLPKGSNTPSSSSSDPYEQLARVNPQYRNTFPEDQVTVKTAWLRPDAFNTCDYEESQELHKKYPNGCKVVIVDDIVVEHCAEALDDHWTILKNPLSDFATFDPLGDLLTNIQDIINDLISLILQTIEQGIPQTWADPAVVNFDQYKQLEAMPGTITPTKPTSGSRDIGAAFYSSKASALSPEVFQFYQIVNQLGQFVSAAMPSIFGGALEAGSSRTASEYAMSRTASLQRLQTPWRMFTIFWKDMFGKGIPAYMKLLKEDEKFVKKDQQGNWVNVWIRKAELDGNIGDIELESAETMPVSDEQKGEWIMKLIELNRDELNAAIFAPENIGFIRKVIKMPEFKLPGEDDRQKQYEEIKQLVAEEPIVEPLDPMQAQVMISQGLQPEPNELPSVEPDYIVDNHLIEAQICRSWLISEAGRLAKVENPAGYKNVLLHLKAHMDMIAQQNEEQMMSEAMNPVGAEGETKPPPPGKNGSGKESKPKPPGKQPGKINGDDDVRTPIQ